MGPRSLSKSGSSRLLSLLIGVIFFTVSVEAAIDRSAARASILPLVTFYSSFGDGEVYNWWAEDSASVEMKDLYKQWYRNLVGQPLTKWEYPAELVKAPQPELQVSALPFEKKMELAKHKAAALLLTGDVRIEPSPMIEQGVRWTQKLEVFRVKNGQKIGETLRIYDLPPHQYRHLLLAIGDSKDFMLGTMTDLHARIENYKPEKLESSTKLVLTGSLSGEQMERIKQHLKGAVQGPVRNPTSAQIISYERDQVVFEIKGLNSEKLNQALVQFHWKGFLTQVISSDSSQVVFDVQSKNSIQ